MSFQDRFGEFGNRPHAADRIAVIGMACRVPGADDLGAFGERVRAGHGATAADPATGLRLDDVESFDAGFFGVSPREAEGMDPQQRLALELAWAALEDAGIVPATLIGTRTSVLVGAMTDDFAALSHDLGAPVTHHTMTGTQRGIIANRIAYLLGTRGASLVVDTGQSSSLVAVHLANAGLRAGDADLAIAGGVHIARSARAAAVEKRFGALSAHGRCAPFDADADGYLRSEGGGFVVLKPLAAALADDDDIYCVLAGSAVNSDGVSDSLTTPSAEAQAEVLRECYRRAGLTPTDVGYVELHGTGTQVGDPVEAAALGAVLGRNRATPLLVGSAKENVGHLFGAAGIIGLIRAALVVRHGEAPPSPHFRAPNPAARLAERGITVPRTAQRLAVSDRTGERHIAGVSSFGMGGTNCHVAVLSPPGPLRPRGGLVPWVLSARDRCALRAQAERLLPATAAEDERDIAFSLATTRTAFARRAVVLGAGHDELRAGLTELAGGTESPAVTEGEAVLGDTAFAFAGQGGQWPGMGLALRSNPVFAAAFAECGAALGAWVDWSLADVVADPAALARTEVVQPVQFALAVALAELWRSAGVRPAAVLGHSQGEIAAAVVAGALSLEDGARVVALRAIAIAELLTDTGGMLAVALSEQEAQEFVVGRPEVAVGAVSGPASVVLSGPLDALRAIESDLTVRSGWVDVAYPSHSALVEPVAGRLAADLAPIRPRAARVPFFSTVTGGQLDTRELDADYWYRNLRQTVRFADAVAAARAAGIGRVLEVSPHPVLTGAVREQGLAATGTLRRDDGGPDRYLRAAAELHVLGHDVDWTALLPAARRVHLPSYPFQRERHWPDPGQQAPMPAPARAGTDRRTAVRDNVAAVLGLRDPAQLDEDARFRQLGFDSAMLVELADRLTDRLGVPCTVATLFDHPTTARLVVHLAGDRDVPDVGPAQATRGADENEDPLVIVGMACRLPGGIATPEDLWQLLVDERDAVSIPPEDRGWSLDGVLADVRGGFLTDAGGFDAGFFGISPREALAMDPQQRLLLEVAWEAIERAGLDPAALAGTDTGVFVGATASGYGPPLHDAPAELSGYVLTGSTGGVLSGRIAYVLGLTGPALTVDTACSSSLVALHQAAQALRAGECGLALACGVAVMARPGMFTEFARQGGLAADGRCKSFGEDADGTGWAEGVGVLVLARASVARRDGLPVLAVVRGSAVNSDGASNGLTAPSGVAQQAVIRAALGAAGLGPSDVDVLEAHGTGTRLGDPIEAGAVLATYGRGRERPLWLGSVKSNVGHTQAAAGIAGVIKIVLAMRHGLLPRSLFADPPSSRVDWSAGAVALLDTARPWPEVGRPRRGAVSSFGISGTNAHVILEQAAEFGDESSREPVLLPWVFSARSSAALSAQAAGLAGVAALPQDIGRSLLDRPRFDHRAVALSGVDSLRGWLAGNGALGAENVVSGRVVPGSTVFVFPGQGAQWAGMAQQLLAVDEVFEGTLAACAVALAPYVDWSLTEALGDKEALARVDVVQPALFAVMVSLAAVWQAHGVRPDAVVGHSQGEIAAAVIAGALSLSDGARVVALRSQAIATALAGTGGMLSLAAPEEQVLTLLDGDAAIAAVNGPATVVVAGGPDALHEVESRTEAAGIRTRRIDVDYASHSAHVTRLADRLATDLAPIRPRAGSVPFYSTVTGGLLDTRELGAAYWYRNLRQTVRFADTTRALMEAGFSRFIEVSPHPVLLTGVMQTAEAADRQVAAVGTLRRDDGGPARFVRSLAEAHVYGVPVDWQQLFAGSDTRRVTLPTYPFQHTTFWTAAGGADAAGVGRAEHPLLSSETELVDGGLLATGRLSLRDQPWLSDHAVTGHAVVPAAALLELVMYAGRRTGCPRVAELTIEAPLVVPERGAVLVQLRIGEVAAHGRRAVTMHARPADVPDARWHRVVVGDLDAASSGPEDPATPWLPEDAESIPLDDEYTRLAERGFGYGPHFRGLHAAWRAADDTVFADVRLPGPAGDAGFALHPALFDAVLHPWWHAGLAPTEHGRLPFAWTGVSLHATGATALRVRMRRTGEESVTITATDPAGAPVVTIESLTLRPMTAGSVARAGEPLYVPQWRPLDLPARAAVDFGDTEVLVVRSGDGPAPAAIRAATGLVLERLRGTITDPEGRLLVVTSGASSIGGVPVDPAAAAVCGLVRSAQSEHPGRIVLLDLSASTGAVDDDLAAAALRSGEPQLAVRDHQLLVPRLASLPRAEPGDRSGLGWDPDGTVLITGGTGGLGAVLARHLVARHGMRRLALVSRRGQSGEAFIAELTELGAEVTVHACDVAERKAVADLLSTLENPLTAVVHAAGVLRDGIVSALDDQSLDTVLRPKADAAWHLHELAGDLAGFVMFSSIAGVFGNPGQGNYAAANAALDALAEHRHAAGLPATSICWGGWRQRTGMTAHGVEHLGRAGFPLLGTEQGLAWFDEAVCRPAPVVIASHLDHAALRARPAIPALLRDLVPAILRASTPDTGLRERVAALPQADREGAVLRLVRTAAAAVLGHGGGGAVEATRAFREIGFDSLTAVELRNRLGEATGLRLPPTVVFDHPEPATLARYLLTRLTGEPAAPAAPARPQVVSADDPVVIVGMSCRYPGGVGSPDDLWALVRDGREGVGEFPRDRGWDLGSLVDQGTSHTRAGGFLPDATDFDTDFFGISPREALTMDPQHRLLLESTWHALEHAGIDPGTLRGSDTGVFTGVMYHDYASGNDAIADAVDGYLVNGVAGSMASGRIAYAFGFEGPALTIDTACSSSLVALHQAVQALRARECSLAVAGGVTVLATARLFVDFTKQGGLSADGRCHSFADDADGTGFAEGVGLLVLERRSDAVRNGHHILAIVRGSAVNSDGASNGVTAPNGPAQQRVIRAALASAGLRPSDVDVVEGHGTGTRLGDPIEAGALHEVYGQGRERPLWLGSVKSNIGHAQAAAGVAGVIKMVQAMRHGVLPRTLHADKPSAQVDWSVLALLTEPVDWAVDALPRRAAVSSFGISGTNAHVVLEQGDPDPEPGEDSGEPVPWVLSARSEAALRAQARQLGAVRGAARSIGWSLLTRAQHDHRAVVFDPAALTALAEGAEAPGLVRGTALSGRVAFVFPGQGTQWAGMAKEVYAADAVFAEALDECGAVLASHLDWSLPAVLGDADALARVDVVQPALFAVMVSLARLWHAHGVRPDAVVGHSQGEIAAAVISGALSLADGARVVALRSRAIAEELSGAGGMMSVAASLDRVSELVGDDAVSVAAVNGPATVVLSGAVASLDVVADRVAAAGIRVRRVDVDYASHSAQVERIEQRLAADLAGLTPRHADIPFYSTVTGGWLDTRELTGRYWYRNLRDTVRFADAVDGLLGEGFSTLVEISPHPVLTVGVEQVADERGEPVAALATLRRDDGGPRRFTAALAEAEVRGVPVDWTQVLPGSPCRIILPGYPFQRQRFWLPAGAASGVSAGGTDTGDPLLGTRLDLADAGTDRFTADLSALDDEPWAASPSLPLVAALAAADHLGVSGVRRLVVDAVAGPLAAARLQVTVEPRTADVRRLTIHIGRRGEWTTLAYGELGATGGDTAAHAAAEHEVAGTVTARASVPGLLLPPDVLDAALAIVDPDGSPPAEWHGVTLHATDPGEVTVRSGSCGDGLALRLDDQEGAAILTADRVLRRPLRAAGPHLHVVEPVEVPPAAGSRRYAVLGDAPRTGAGVEPVPCAGLDVVPADVDLVLLPVPRRDGGFAERARAAAHWALDTLHTALTAEPGAPIVFVTRDAEHEPDAAAVRGLVRSARAEHPGSFRLLDLPADADATIPVLPDDEPDLVLRGGSLSALRLVAVTGAGDALPGFDPDGTVLVTGATGTLGGLCARHLVDTHRVRHLLLLSRRAHAAPGAEQLVADLTGAGAAVTLEACDVADRDALAAALASVPAEHPLTAVVHIAGVLDDGVVESLDHDRIDAMLRPKADAAVHLHELTADHPLAAFVLFSSAATTFGTAGQAGYSAANAVLDALGAHRRALGLPAMSLAWGRWATASAMTGGLTDADTDRLRRTGIGALSDSEGLALFDRALGMDRATCVPVRLDLAAGAEPPALLRELVVRPVRRLRRAAPGGADGLAARLAGLTGADRDRALTDLVREYAARVLGHPDASAVDPRREFARLGFDSLTAVELRNRISAAAGVRLGVGAVFDYPSPLALARHIGTRLHGPEPALPEHPDPDPVGPPVGTDIDDDLTRITDDELFDFIDDYLKGGK